MFRCASCKEEIGFNPSDLHFATEIRALARNAIILFGVPITAAFVHASTQLYGQLSAFVFLFGITFASICLHELFHALVALVGGDFSVWKRGYLRLSPRKYFVSSYSLLLPAALFAFTGFFLPSAAVFIQLHLLKSRLYWAAVYSAGVIANFIILAVIIFLIKSDVFDANHQIIILFHTAAYLQLIIIVFNLTPVPGLDGWGIISAFLPTTFLELITKVSLPAIIGFLALLLFTDVLDGYLRFISSLTKRVGINIDFAVAGMDYINVAKIFGLF